jgi:cellulose synthase/poly-beta-1,6-N-acetylglucosamine synthase-like glycosyltransferase
MDAASYKGKSSLSDLIIGILRCDRPVTPAWEAALNALQIPDGLTVRHAIITSPGQNKFNEIEAARNELAERSQDARYLFFLDDDVIPPAGALVKLVGVLAENPEARICGGLYPRRNGRHVPGELMVWKGNYEDDTTQVIASIPDGAFRCDSLPTGCMLIDTRIFSELPKPWFQVIYFNRRSTQVPDGYLTIKITEDVHFCRKVVKAGYEVWSHGGVICEHENPAVHYLISDYLTSQL